LVTNGNRRLVWHNVTEITFAAVDVSMNLGMVSEAEATPPAAAVKAAVGVGA
jgi:hypothetical protein